MSDDFGFRTGPKRPKKKRTEKEPSSSSKSRPSKSDSRKVSRKKESKRSSKRESGSAAAAEPAKKPKPKKRPSKEELPPLEAPSKLPLIAGLVVALLVVGGVVAVLNREAPAPPPAAPETTAIVGEKNVASLPQPPQRTGPALRTQSMGVKGVQVKVAKPIPVETKPQAKPKVDDALARLRKKSSTHAAIARVLDELSDLFDPKKLVNPGPNFELFQQRRKREQELIAQLREMGPLAVDALKDMILGLNDPHSRIVMGKALAGIEGPQAGSAISEILKTVKDVSIQTAIVRNLPETPGAADTIADAFKAETNSTLRSLLLHEYSNRLGKDASTDVFRDAAKDPDINVRATAVTIIGRRGDPQDQALMEDLIRNEKSLMIRQKAILSYALTGGSSALPTLESLTRDPSSSLAVRASAVLGISRVGGRSRADAERAIQVLDQIALSDQHPEIQARAKQAARNLRRNLQRKNDRLNRRAPLRVEPGMGPMNKR